MNFDFTFLREAMTVVSFGAFIGIVWFAVHPINRQRFETAAKLPPDEAGL
jgi:cbb3-type cytochrome oxidase subunit 3